MIDLTLTQEQELLRDTARDFAAREIAPVAKTFSACGRKNVEPWKYCEAMFRKGKELGFTTMLIPEAFGGGGLRCIDAAIVLEELAVADISVAADYFALNMTTPLIIATAATEEQKAAWLGDICSSPTFMLSGALSEPNVAGSELFCPDPNPRFGIKSFARREGDKYVINGQKSAFVTNAGLADAYFIMARTDLDRPLRDSISVFYVPANTPGLRAGERTDMIGWHTSRHAELFLDNVSVGVDRRIGKEGDGALIVGSIPHMPICLAACFVGLARAAFEYARDYAKTRKSWGKPLAEHQAVALKLSEMYVDLQTARLLVWDAALGVDTDPMRAATLKAPAAKTHAVDVAIRNAGRAVEVLGAYGITTEYPVGRYLNDAWIGYSCDFTRDLLHLGMSGFLRDAEA